MNSSELPLGFCMALAQNEKAMRKFESLSPAQKEAVVRQTRLVRSKREMQGIVAALTDAADKEGISR